MKVIDLQEAKAHLEQYAQDCQWSPVIVTVDGKPTFEMIPIPTRKKIASPGQVNPVPVTRFYSIRRGERIPDSRSRCPL